MGSRNTPFLAVLACLVLACADAGEFPSGPVAPPTPESSANVVASSGLSFGLCTTPGCQYFIEYRNEGTGCANSLRGTIRLYEDETLLESDDWWLESTLLLKPGDSAPVEDCCFTPDGVRRRTRFATETFWNNVPCD